MAEETIYCPSCNHKLRVPEELLGTMVQCPMCNQTFTAPPRARPAAPPPPMPGQPPEVLPAGAYAPPPPPPGPYGTPGPFAVQERPAYEGYELEERKRAARRSLMIPAIGLIVSAILGGLYHVPSLVTYTTRPGAYDEVMAQANEINRSFGLPESQVPLPVMLAILGGFLLVDLLVIVAAVCMLRLKMYWAAMAGGVLGMLNCTSLCCLFGVPFGIWAFILLLQPHVRDAFD